MKAIMDQNKRDEVKSVRKIKPTRRSVSGIYSFRGHTPIQFESTLERDFIIRNEFSPSVVDIVSQPFTLPFNALNGRCYEYTPDFLIRFSLDNESFSHHQIPILVEVKPYKDWHKNWRKWMPKWKAAWRYARERGYEFHIFDEYRIRDQRFKNIRFLERYKQYRYPEAESQLILKTLSEMGGAPFHYILARHYRGLYVAEGIAHVWHLLAVRRLECDIDRPLNMDTEFWIPNNE